MPEQLPTWLNTGVEPPESLKTNGWQPGMKPSAQHMNWLFNRAYTALNQFEKDFITHKAESASAAHGKIRKEYILFSGALASGSAALSIPQGFNDLNDFDEIIFAGTLNSISPSTWKHTTETVYPKNINNVHSISWSYNFIYAGYTYVDYHWMRFLFDKDNKTIAIMYNRKKEGTRSAEDTLDNLISLVIGVKYE